MHCNLLSAARGVALDDLLESLAVFLPYLLFLAAEADVLLYGVSKSQRSLALCGAAEETVLLILDESIENLLEFLAVAVRVKGKTRERSYGLAEKTCLKP